jgi:hypothetical protein
MKKNRISDSGKKLLFFLDRLSRYLVEKCIKFYQKPKMYGHNNINLHKDMYRVDFYG